MRSSKTDYYLLYKKYKCLYKRYQSGGDSQTQAVCQFVNNNRVDGSLPVVKSTRKPYLIECTNREDKIVGVYQPLEDLVIFYDNNEKELYRISGPFNF